MRKQAEQLVVGRVYADREIGREDVALFRYNGGESFTLIAGKEYATIKLNETVNFEWYVSWYELTPEDQQKLNVIPEEDAIYNKPSDPTFTLSDIQRVIERIENEMAECGYTLTEHGLRIAIEIMREELKLEVKIESSNDTNNKLTEVFSNGICKEQNCKEKATVDYNGHGHWVCQRHYDKLSEYFDDEYK